MPLSHAVCARPTQACHSRTQDQPVSTCHCLDSLFIHRASASSSSFPAIATDLSSMVTARYTASPLRPRPQKVARNLLLPSPLHLIATDLVTQQNFHFSPYRHEKSHHRLLDKFAAAGELITLSFLSEEIHDVANHPNLSFSSAGDRRSSTPHCRPSSPSTSPSIARSGPPPPLFPLR
jgi:hypothetical protein